MHFIFKDKEQKQEYIGSQSFSGIDLDKNKDELGIVYPYDYKETIINGVTSSSIIDLHSDENTLLKHTEVRVCNTTDKDKLVYEQLDTTSIVICEKENVSYAKKMLYGLLNNNDCVEGYIESSNRISITDDMLTLMKIYKGFEHTFTIIDSKNVSKERKEIPYTYHYKDYKEPTLFPNYEKSINDEKSIVVDETEESIYILNDNTPNHIADVLRKLEEIPTCDFKYIDLEYINEFYNYFLDNRKYVRTGFLEGFLMDLVAYDCTREKEIKEFRDMFKLSLTEEEISITTEYILGMLKNNKEKENENTITYN